MSNSIDAIHIERVKVGELVAFADDVIASAKEGQFIPITRQRALAHAHNPLADAQDIALLVAYQKSGDYSGREIVGFFGIMPIQLKFYGRLEKVHWFSTWRVAPYLRGKSVGSSLMKEALSLEEDFLIVGSGPARRVCKRFEFWERDPLVYHQLDLSGMIQHNPATWLSRMARKLLRLFAENSRNVRIDIDNRLTRGVDRLFSPFTRAVFSRLLRSRLRLPDGIRILEVDRVREETAEQLANLQPVELRRGAPVVNWMLEYPWVVEPGESPTEHMDFYFSDVRKRFQLIALELFSDRDEYLGYMVLQVSQSDDGVNLKLLDFSLRFPEDQDTLLAVAFHYALKYNARLVDLPSEAVARFRKTRLGRWLLVRRERIYQCHPRSEDSILATAWEKIHFKYTDGDMPFT